MYNVDIDVGGTLTDGIFTDAGNPGRRRICAKVDSTAHDLTVCLFDCLTQGANQLGFSSLSVFLEQVQLLRWSTTLTSNVLAELRGPKIGLIVTAGHEKDLYSGQQTSLLLNRLVDSDNIVGIERGDGLEILTAVRALLEAGVRRICVSLKGALQGPQQELEIKRIVEEQYPDHFLGAVPVLVGSDICQNTDDMTRTYYAVINAYTHSALAATLFKAEDELRYRQGYAGALLISHTSGGVAGVAKTRAIDTIESGPILGIYGSQFMAQAYGLNDVIALDVGGTTAKVGAIHSGEPVYAETSDLFGIPLRARLPYLRSIALGGGSVVSVSHDRVRLGPESMGSFPGPACYALGGDKAALTDAFVAAGLINPEYFLGGTKPLDLQAAREAIEKNVAQPLGIGLPEACATIMDCSFHSVASLITSSARELKQDLSRHALFAYGGNGGLFACPVAERAGIAEVYLFALGPVFSAFGSSVADISHVYERSFRLALREDSDIEPLNQLLAEMRSTGIRDLLGENISPDNAEYSADLEVSIPGQSGVQAKTTQLHFSSTSDLRRLLAINSWPTGASLELVRMQVKKSISKPSIARQEAGPEDPGDAFLGTRTLAYGGATEATLYKWERLRAGNKLAGCALLESDYSTYFVPPGWHLEIDHYGNARVTRM